MILNVNGRNECETINSQSLTVITAREGGEGRGEGEGRPTIPVLSSVLFYFLRK